MILRAPVFIGLAWLALSHSPVPGFMPAGDDAWRQTVLQRLDAMKVELAESRSHTMHKPMEGVKLGGGISRLVDLAVLTTVRQ